MYERMLVPLDGSPLAEMVLPYVSQLAARFTLQVTFFHVCHGQEPSLFMCQSYIQHIAEAMSAKLAANHGTATGIAVSGNVAEEVLRQADESRTDLVLMASHGHSGRGFWTLGSTVHKVVTASHLPVMVVRDELPADIADGTWPSTIIVPLDGSTLSEAAIPHAQAMSKGGGKLNLLRVCDAPAILADYPESVMPDSWDEHVKLTQQGAEKACMVYLDGIEEEFKKEGLATDRNVVLGRAAEEIVKYVNSEPAALVVMSTHGQSGISRWPYGHVADRVLLACKNPLLLIRPRKP